MISGAIVQQKVSVPYIIITWHVILFNPLSDLIEKSEAVSSWRDTQLHMREHLYFCFFYRFVKQSC